MLQGVAVVPRTWAFGLGFRAGLVSEGVVEGDGVDNVLVPLQCEQLLASQRVPHLQTKASISSALSGLTKRACNSVVQQGG